MPESPEIRYAKSGDRHVAYQILGEGPIDLLGLSIGCNVWIDRDDEPHWNRFDRRLASFSRLIRFDPGGVGLSDPLVGGSGPTIECWTQDAAAVLDAVGSPHAALFGVANGGLVALLFAATYPERTSSLVLMHCFARMVRDWDYPWGWPQEVVQHFVDAVTDPGYRGDIVDDLALSAPSLARDVEFRSWWKRAGEHSGTPATARAQDLVSNSADMRSVLPTIQAPTLVLHRVDNPFLRIGQGRYLAENIAGAKFLELPGEDHLPFAGEPMRCSARSRSSSPEPGGHPTPTGDWRRFSSPTSSSPPNGRPAPVTVPGASSSTTMTAWRAGRCTASAANRSTPPAMV